MKKITILGEEFEYEKVSIYDEVGHFDDYTKFYQGAETLTKRKYGWFGEKITESVPKEVFTIYFWIEGAVHLTKEELRAKLEREVKLLHRKRELERGEII